MLLPLLSLTLPGVQPCMRPLAPHLVEPLPRPSSQPVTENPSELPTPGKGANTRYPRNFTFNAFWQSRYLRLSLVSRGPYFPTGGGGNVQQLHKHFGQLELWAGSCHQGWGGSRLANTALDPWWPPLHLVGQPHWPVDPLQSQFQDLSQQVSHKLIAGKAQTPSWGIWPAVTTLNYHHCIVFKQKNLFSGESPLPEAQTRLTPISAVAGGRLPWDAYNNGGEWINSVFHLGSSLVRWMSGGRRVNFLGSSDLFWNKNIIIRWVSSTPRTISGVKKHSSTPGMEELISQFL